MPRAAPFEGGASTAPKRTPRSPGREAGGDPRRTCAPGPIAAPLPLGEALLVDGRLALDGTPRQTFANIGLYDTRLFRELPRGTKLKLLPYLQRWIAEGRVSGETFAGFWANVGTPDDLAQLDAALR